MQAIRTSRGMFMLSETIKLQNSGLSLSGCTAAADSIEQRLPKFRRSLLPSSTGLWRCGMTISEVELLVPNAEKVNITKDTLTVDLSDGRTISVPLAWFPRLLHATVQERRHWKLIGKGQ